MLPHHSKEQQLSHTITNGMYTPPDSPSNINQFDQIDLQDQPPSPEQEEPEAPSIPTEEDNDIWYEVKGILDHRIEGETIYFLVDWAPVTIDGEEVNYEPSWEPEENYSGCQESVEILFIKQCSSEPQSFPIRLTITNHPTQI